MKWTQAVIPLAAGLSLLYVDVRFAASLAQYDILSKATVLEFVVFGTQVGKTVAALAVKELRNASVGFLVDFYGAELLILPLAGLVYFLFHAPWAISALDQIIVGWMIGAAFATLPFVAYKISEAMLRSGDLAFVVPAGMVALEVGLLFIGAGSAAGTKGLDGLLSAVIQGGVVKTSSTDLPVFASATVLLVSLLLYSLLGGGARPAAMNRSIAIGGAALLACFGWVLAASLLTSSFILMLTAPTLCVSALAWWMGRGS
jgi:hypothetical protein